jgi:glycolate oxidase FAD binding subunit
MHDLIAEWSERIRAAAAAGDPLLIRGSGSKDFYGSALTGAPLDTRTYRGIVDYEPTELVLTARSGTPLADIEQTLAAFVLGVRILDGRGDDLAFGGKVMKNVAGYDVSRVMVGAMGTLGLLLDISLKVLPAPAREASLRFELDAAQAIGRMNAWAGRPYGISATWHEARTLTLRVSGTEEGVEDAQRRLGGEPLADADRFWHDVREQQWDANAGAAPLWRIAVKPTTPPLPLPGSQAIEWNGALRWLRTDADPALVRELARRAGGHATCFRGANEKLPTFHPLPEPLMRLHTRLKSAFDPARVLNRGRLYPGL